MEWKVQISVGVCNDWNGRFRLTVNQDYVNYTLYGKAIAFQHVETMTKGKLV